jgi:hypothetical protein
MADKEYIERGAFLRKCAEAFGHYGVAIKAIEGIADECTAADVVEVRHGEWKQATEPCGWHDVDCVVCSACGESWILDGDFDFDVVKDFWNYCPACGAKMDGERKEQT